MYYSMSQTSLFLIFCLSFLLTSNGSFIHVQGRLSSSSSSSQDLKNQQAGISSVSLPCNLTSLTAEEPTIVYIFEAGRSEFWYQFIDEFVCAGVAAVRNTLEPNGLLLPHYLNAPQLLYVQQGEGIEGTVFPGCPNEYETKTDQFQKVGKFRKGDILALPAGVTHWFYNTGDENVVLVSVFNVRSQVNQLDPLWRIFFLAGNYPILPGQGPSTVPRYGNIFTSFAVTSLAESFNISPELASQLIDMSDHRGRIVFANISEIKLPNTGEEQGRNNVVSEQQGTEGVDNICTRKLELNLIEENPDWYNQCAGTITSINSQKIPYLDLIQLSAQRVVLFKNAIFAPHWNVNAHSILYIIKGSIRVEVNDQTGNSLFLGEIFEGQIIVLIQLSAILMKAGEHGCEFIAFKTNANAEISTLAGRMSTIQAIPVEVLMNSYNVSREDANKLKYNRQESILFCPVKT